MRRSAYCYTIAASLLMLSACSSTQNEKDTPVVVHDTVYVQESAPQPKAHIPAREEEVADASVTSPGVESVSTADPFASVDKWVVTITGVTTINKPISAAEAQRYERELANGEYDLWVDFNEDDQCYYLMGHDEVEMDKKTITNPRHVSRLNALMGQSDYRDYRADVTIRNNTAYARWYGGNRGGGITDDFPSDLARLFY